MQYHDGQEITWSRTLTTWCQQQCVTFEKRQKYVKISAALLLQTRTKTYSFNSMNKPIALLPWLANTAHFIGPMKYSVHYAIDQLVSSCHKITAGQCIHLHTHKRRLTHTSVVRHRAGKWGQRWFVVIHLTSMTAAANKSLIHHLIHRLSPPNSWKTMPSQNTLPVLWQQRSPQRTINPPCLM